jgi:hypothetical protein
MKITTVASREYFVGRSTSLYLFIRVSQCYAIERDRSFYYALFCVFYDSCESLSNQTARWTPDRIELVVSTCYQFHTGLILRSWKGRRYFPLKFLLIFNGLQGVISQKIELLTGLKFNITICSTLENSALWHACLLSTVWSHTKYALHMQNKRRLCHVKWCTILTLWRCRFAFQICHKPQYITLRIQRGAPTGTSVEAA